MIQNVCHLVMEGSEYVFIHKAFQEYFCTRCIENLDEEFISQLPEVYDENEAIRNSSVFDMLYDQKKDKFEKHIILPYLKRLFDSLDKKNEYHDFICKCFNYIRVSEGLIDENDCDTSSNMPFYEFIIKKILGISPIRPLEIRTIYNEITIEEYGMQLRGRNFEFYVPLNESDDPSNPTGHLMEIKPEILFNNQDKYSDIISALDNKNSNFYEEFNALHDYYFDVIKRVEEKSSLRSNMLRKRSK